MNGWYGPMAGGGLLMGLTGLLVLVALVAAGVWLVRTAGRPGERGGSGSRAAAVLAERYARGEIDDDEYERRRRILDGDHPAR